MKRQKLVSRRGALVAGAVSAASIALAPTVANAEDSAASDEQLSLSADDAIGFLYIESDSLESGTEQNIAIALDGYSGISSASLSICSTDDGTMSETELTNSVDSSMLFSFAAEEGSYEVVALEVFLQDGRSLAIDFGDCDSENRSFEVAAPGIALMSADSAPEADEDGIATEMYALDSDGEVAQVDSIQDALSVADAGDDSGVAVQSLGSSRAVSGGFVIALDPGHGGVDGGASGVNGSQEANLTWKIANYCRDELESYAGVSAVLTRSENEVPTLKVRAQRAKNAGARVLVSIHLNSASGDAHGAEVWVPNTSSYYASFNAEGTTLGENILGQLKSLGLTYRGVKTRTIYADGYKYADGSNGDYYGIIRESRKLGMPAIIVEHAFIDSASDYRAFLSDDSKLRKLALADANGIVNTYGLTKDPSRGSAMYRLYNPNSGEHFYTASSSERDSVSASGWGYEGVAWYAPSSGAPVYRLYNPNAGDHHYTTSSYERDHLVSVGWRYEGVCWHSAPSSGAPVYRLYNPNARSGAHHYTTSPLERDHLVSVGWRSEGIGWYANAN